MIFERIIKVREELNFSKQKDFAAALDIPFRTYQTYEQHSVKALPHTFIEKLAEQYNVSLNWLFFGIGHMFTNDTQNNVFQGNKETVSSNSIEDELIHDIKLLSKKRQQYYYHRVKADLIDEEI